MSGSCRTPDAHAGSANGWGKRRSDRAEAERWNSVLFRRVVELSDSLTHVLRWVVLVELDGGEPEDISEDVVLMELNSDFSTKGMSSDEITACRRVAGRCDQSGDDVFDLFRRVRCLPAGRTDEEECKLTAVGAPKWEMRARMDTDDKDRERRAHGVTRPTRESRGEKIWH